MLTECTSPSAPFYELDLIGISFAEAFDIDLPCTQLIAVGAVGLLLVWTGLAILAFLGIRKAYKGWV